MVNGNNLPLLNKKNFYYELAKQQTFGRTYERRS